MIFLSNELIDPNNLRKLRIPIAFITFAFMRGTMYSFHPIIKRGIAKHFAVRQEDRYSRHNNIVYGALFHLDHEEVFMHNLDAMHNCSRYLFRKNNIMDEQHRIKEPIYPIRFDTLEDFSRLKYIEREPVNAWCYVGNIYHPKIKPRLTKNKRNYRITQGILPDPFKKLFWEVSK